MSQQESAPFHRFEFEAGFEEQEEGKSFRYNVRGAYYRQEDGEYTKTLRPLKEDHKQQIFPIIERTAHKVLGDLRKKDADAKATGDGNTPATPPTTGSAQ